MKYKGKTCELIGEKEVLVQCIAWIRLMEDGSFHEVPFDELGKPSTEFSMPYLRFVSIAAKIKDEVARKNILAPYECSLIPLPHQILVLEKVMHSNQNRFMLADEYIQPFGWNIIHIHGQHTSKITKIYGAFKEGPYCKILRNEDFGYLEEIRADILKLESETDGLIHQILD